MMVINRLNNRKSNRIWMILLYVIVLICYYPIFSNGFLDAWDDQWMVMNAYTEKGWNLTNVYAILTQPHHGQYSPLVQLNYLLLHSLCGYNPMAYHLMSFVWHTACVTVLYFFLQHTFCDKAESKHCTLVIVLTTTIFAVQPVQVESVAWVSAQKVLMYSFFYLSAILFYVKYTKQKQLPFYLLTLLCFLCSVLCKEQAVVLPCTLFLMDWFTRRDWKDLDVWLEKLPFVVISIGFAYLTWKMQHERSEILLFTLPQRVVFCCYSLFEYITKSLLPINLNYLYPFPMMDNSTDIPFRFYTYPFWTGALIMCLYYYRHNRILIFGSLFFLIHLLPILHIIPLPRTGIVADRYMYIPIIGILLLFSNSVAYLVNKWHTKVCRIILGCSVFVYIGYMCAYTHSYCSKWKDTDSVKSYLRGFYIEQSEMQSKDGCKLIH